MNTKVWKPTLFLTLLFLTACVGNTISLEGTTWQLVDLAGKPLVPNHQPTISFDEGRVSGNASCNTYGGDYKLNGERIEFGMMMSTLMACADNAAMEQEQQYLALLGNAETWELRNGQLYLFSAEGETMVFERIAAE